MKSTKRAAMVAGERILFLALALGLVAAGPAAAAPNGDADHDGINDADDWCPDEPETVNKFEDEDGCPDEPQGLIQATKDRIQVLEKIQFTTGKATLLPASKGLLDRVAAFIKASPQIKKVRI